MKITGNESERMILEELGNRIKQYRISLSLTQKNLAEKCGVSSSTVVRLEKGVDLSVLNYLKILSALGLLQNLDLIVPEVQEDYKALFEKQAQRQRARKSKNKPKSTWIWADCSRTFRLRRKSGGSFV